MFKTRLVFCLATLVAFVGGGIAIAQSMGGSGYPFNQTVTVDVDDAGASSYSWTLPSGIQSGDIIEIEVVAQSDPDAFTSASNTFAWISAFGEVEINGNGNRVPFEIGLSEDLDTGESLNGTVQGSFFHSFVADGTESTLFFDVVDTAAVVAPSTSLTGDWNFFVTVRRIPNR